ncbi:MAG: hypothetical protein D6776_10205 [Planctomycetota bacterium]|nr:MAG: hypothetical protein D6776_10205 [Planctomycetota bacterium]
MQPPPARRTFRSPTPDLFDPARLRERWERSARGTPPAAPPSSGEHAPPPEPAPSELLRRLEAQIATRLPPAGREMLRPLLEALAPPLAELASPTVTAPRRAALQAELQQRLTALEDALEALLLSTGASP